MYKIDRVHIPHTTISAHTYIHTHYCRHLELPRDHRSPTPSLYRVFFYKGWSFSSYIVWRTTDTQTVESFVHFGHDQLGKYKYKRVMHIISCNLCLIPPSTGVVYSLQVQLTFGRVRGLYTQPVLWLILAPSLPQKAPQNVFLYHSLTRDSIAQVLANPNQNCSSFGEEEAQMLGFWMSTPLPGNKWVYTCAQSTLVFCIFEGLLFF